MHDIDNILANHMGDRFFKLARLLQHLHNGNHRLAGNVFVKRGNWFARALTRFLKLPAPSSSVYLQVDCSHSGDTMIWNRSFDGHVMRSVFELEKSTIVESFGPLRMHFMVEESSSDLHYRQVKTYFGGLLLPQFLAPKVVANEKEVDGKYQFYVNVKWFLVGQLISYGGQLTEQKA